MYSDLTRYQERQREERERERKREKERERKQRAMIVYSTQDITTAAL